ncbi:unnamed protein product [Owenia fusiformis]|uniref:Uncharacterized protein n=1 Tax=Owenia fusiformis TaxID=6347 RepID=A0A8J1TQN8_OWEFU|nr:unnamed protein product [Owenia fusiformis]
MAGSSETRTGQEVELDVTPDKMPLDQSRRPPGRSHTQSESSELGMDEGEVVHAGVVNKRFPIRPGIIWAAGGKVEAMDYQKKWFPAKIMEVDDKELEVLIHFDGWNQRYDEWISMDSDRLRPMARHSDRKTDKGKKFTKCSEFKPGEQVYAKWTDCRLYPAKVIGLDSSSGSYHVKFYDGFSKLVEPMNIRTMTAEQRKESEPLIMPATDAIKPRSAEKKRLSTDKESPVSSDKEKPTLTDKEKRLSIEKEKRLSIEKEKKPSSEKRLSTDKDKRLSLDKEKRLSTDKAPLLEKDKKLTSDKEVRLSAGKDKTEKPKALGTPVKKAVTPGKQRTTEEQRKQTNAQYLKKRKLIVGGAFQEQSKRMKNALGKDKSKKKAVGSPMSKTDLKKNLDLKSPKISIPNIDQLMLHTPPWTPAQLASLNIPSPNLDVRLTKVQRIEKRLPGKKVKRDRDGRLVGGENRGRKSKKRSVSPTCSESSATSHSTIDYVVPKKRAGDSRKPSSERSKPYSWEYVPATTPAPHEFHIEEDHNPYKCTHPGCSKAFRKEKLLAYHVKYYHDASGTNKPRKRQHTSSMCSTDSEASMTSSSKVPKISPGRSRHHSRGKKGSVSQMSEAGENLGDIGMEGVIIKEESVEDALPSTSSMTTDSDLRERMQVVAEEEEEESLLERPPREEVINCICQDEDENGLMVQCEVCFCWQHALCFDLSETSMPKKYICYVCLDPPGIRDSARSIHDQDWFKYGVLARFNFLPPQDEESPAMMKAAHDLMADMINIKSVLTGLSRKLLILKNKEHPDMKLWVKDWDREMEREKALAAAMEIDNIPMATDDFSNVRFTLGDEHSQHSLFSDVIETTDNDTPTDRLDIGAIMQQEDSKMEPSKASVDNKSTIKENYSKDSITGEFNIDSADKENIQLIDKDSEANINVLDDTDDAIDVVGTDNNIGDSEATNHVTINSDKERTLNGGEVAQNGVGADHEPKGDNTTPSVSSAAPPSTLSLGPPSGQDYKLSPLPSSVRIGSSVWTPVAAVKNLTNFDAQQEDDSISTVADSESNFANCEKHLTEHIQRVQEELDTRLDLIEDQLDVLETVSGVNVPLNQDILSDVPQLKRSLRTLLSDLGKVKHMATYH